MSESRRKKKKSPAIWLHICKCHVPTGSCGYNSTQHERGKSALALGLGVSFFPLTLQGSHILRAACWPAVQCEKPLLNYK